MYSGNVFILTINEDMIFALRIIDVWSSAASRATSYAGRERRREGGRGEREGRKFNQSGISHSYNGFSSTCHLSAIFLSC